MEKNKINQKFVTGVTFINHKIRIELNLTPREYIMLDFIRNWHLTNKKPIRFDDCWINTGIINRNLTKSFAVLKAKGLLFLDEKDGKVKTTNLFNCKFDDVNLLFEELWKLHHVGTKQIAKACLLKTLKVDTFENIKKGLLKYIEFIKETDQFPMHLSTFLYHKNKIWQEERDASIYKKKDAVAPVIQTGPASAY